MQRRYLAIVTTAAFAALLWIVIPPARAGDPVPRQGAGLNQIPGGIKMYRETNSRGVVAFNIPAGSYELRIESISYELKSQNGAVKVKQICSPMFTFTLPTQNIVSVAVKEEGVLSRGRLPSIAGDPVQGQNVIFKQLPNGDAYMRQTDSRGVAALRLPAGTYEAQVQPISYELKSQNGAVKAKQICTPVFTFTLPVQNIVTVAVKEEGVKS